MRKMGINFLKTNNIAGIVYTVLILICSWIEFYILYPVIEGFRAMRFDNIFEGIVLIVKFVINFIINNVKFGFVHVVILIMGLVIAGAILSLFFSGIFFCINNFIQKKVVSIDEFTIGIKKYFLRMWIVMTIVCIAIILMHIAVFVMAIPAFSVITAYINGNNTLGECIAFNILVWMVIWSFLIFSRMYIFAWFKTSIVREKRCFLSAIKLVDVKFEQILKLLLLIDLIFVIVKVGLVLSGISSANNFIKLLGFIFLMSFNLVFFITLFCDVFNILEE